MIEGGCLCGKVRYRIDGQITDGSHCHCAMCRKAHGAAFGTYGAVQQDQFHWTDGQDLIKIFSSSADMDRTFCSNCGSTFQTIYKPEPDLMYLALGTVDGDPGCRPEYHIYIGSKAPCDEVADDLGQYEVDNN